MTKRILRHASVVGALAAGTVLLFGGAAQAAGPDIVSAGNNGIANGNQVVIPVQVPIDVCGNAVAVAGVAGAGCTGGSDAQMTESVLGDMTSAGNHGIGNGNQVQAPIQVPINVCGNAVAVAGVAGAGCTGGSSADLGGHDGHHAKKAKSHHKAGKNTHHMAKTASMGENGKTSEAKGGKGLLGDMTSVGNNGILNGNQIQAPIQIPVDISGNAIAVLGVAGAGSTGGSSASMG